MEKLLEKINKLYSVRNRKLVLKAYEFAKKAHDGQFRVSGEEYFTHPCHVAEILVDLHFDSATIQAALLHDVLEDTQVTEEEMLKENIPYRVVGSFYFYARKEIKDVLAVLSVVAFGDNLSMTRLFKTLTLGIGPKKIEKVRDEKINIEKSNIAA